MATLGQKIKQYRESLPSNKPYKKCMTQDEFALIYMAQDKNFDPKKPRPGVSIGQYEKDIHRPSRELLAMMSNHIGCSVKDLLDESFKSVFDKSEVVPDNLPNYLQKAYDIVNSGHGDLAMPLIGLIDKLHNIYINRKNETAEVFSAEVSAMLDYTDYTSRIERSYANNTRLPVLPKSLPTQAIFRK
jgi:hypothetical protein